MKRFLFWILELVSGAVLGALIFQAVSLYLTGYGSFVYEAAKIVGYSFGVAIGVYGLGRLLGQSGSFIFALLGAFIGGFLVRLLPASGDTVEGIVDLGGRGAPGMGAQAP